MDLECVARQLATTAGSQALLWSTEPALSGETPCAPRSRARARLPKLPKSSRPMITQPPRRSRQPPHTRQNAYARPIVLKTGSGRQGHSWVRIPPPPLQELNRRMVELSQASSYTDLDEPLSSPPESAGVRRLYTWGRNRGARSRPRVVLLAVSVAGAEPAGQRRSSAGPGLPGSARRGTRRALMRGSMKVR